MKKKKIELQKLSLESFQTSLQKEEKMTVQGGTTWPCGVATWLITEVICESILFGGCATGGRGIICEEGQTVFCGNENPDLPAMSFQGGGGDNCEVYSDNCPVSVGQAGCITTLPKG